MFTGIIQAIGKISAITAGQIDTRLSIEVGSLPFVAVEMGESISINGACMTVVAFDKVSFSADVSRESLALTTLGRLQLGSAVNLERAMRLSDRLGGHLVSGHVDGVGKIKQRINEGRSVRFVISVADELSKYIAQKGSVCIDGVSLTVNQVDKNEFGLQIIPHTLEQTIFSTYTIGDEVNIEVDLIARYLERLLQDNEKSSTLSMEQIIKAGFV